MLFELINELFAFHNFMNDMLMNYLNDFVIIYLNNIIIYSNSKKKYIRDVRKVLQRLRESDIQANADKCKSHTIEIKFLRYDSRSRQYQNEFRKNQSDRRMKNIKSFKRRSMIFRIR